ncbi:MAG: response regulator transcription factor, partial [Anaerolineales bacterium]|nr:response regulator transcription factor [Anaerolineales bacterium]
QEAVRLARETRPDVAIMDIAMPILNGIEATKQIKAEFPTTAILVLSAYDDDQYVFALLEAGAAGYLLKNVRSDELVDAVRSVHAGESILHPAIARKVINHFAHPKPEQGPEAEVEQLTDREIEVLKLAAKGMSNREIADELFISVRTVQVHLTNIFNKIGVGSRVEAILFGLRAGWLALEDTL